MSKNKFRDIPDVDPEALADYFNLEFGLEVAEGKTLRAEDFTYTGIYPIQGIETMVWVIRGYDVCATVQPYGDGYLIAMDTLPDLQ